MRKKQTKTDSRDPRTNKKSAPRGRNSRKSSQYKNGKELTDEAVAKSDNDPQWYASDPAILRDAASFPFSYPTGASDTHDLTLYDATHVAPYSKVPGICSLVTTPNTGFNLRATDPINVASQMVYSFVRHANSGHSNYDAPDLMMYILGMANAYSYLVWCQRLYGYGLTYDQRNRYIPRDLIRTNNVDPDDLRDNLANFRFWINTLIAKMSSFAVPATFSVFSRMTFMYSDYYVEGTSIKEQLYQFVPDGFYNFGLDAQSKGQLIWVPFDRTQLMTVADVMTYGNTLFGSIWNEEDFGIMSGDILKAYGDRIIKLTSIPEAYSIAPKFDPMVLTQIKNSLMLDAQCQNITQSNNLIVQVLSPRNYTTSDKYFGSTTALGSGYVTLANAARLMLLKDFKALTVDTDNPTPEVVMEASRLLYAYDAYLGEVRVGTEYIRQVIVTLEPGTDIVLNQLNFTESQPGSSTIGMNEFNRAIEVVKNFHYMPRIYNLCMTSSGKVELFEFFDLDNFTVLNNTDISKLHQAAVINMYAVPSIGKVM